MKRDAYEKLLSDMEVGEFCAMDASGGNFDDAFELGIEFAEAAMKYTKEEK